MKRWLYIFYLCLLVLTSFTCEKSLQAISETTFINPYSSFIMHQNTIHCSSLEDILARYPMDTAAYPDHVSFVTGQSEKFVAYELIARAVYQIFRPEQISDSQLKNTLFLRYPDQNAPKNLSELFNKVPLSEDYDTASTLVADYLVAANPSLKEDDQDESALAIARSNERDQLLQEVVFKIFIKENIPISLFKDRISTLLKEVPLSDKAGLITRIFLPKIAPLHQVVYRSLAYGLPYCQADLENPEAFRQFYEDYQNGKRWSGDPIPQIRFLSSGVRTDQGFDLETIHMVRYTCISSEALFNYAEKVQQAVQAIFKNYQTQTQELEIRKAAFYQLEEGEQKNLECQWLVEHYLERFDPWSAWKSLSYLKDATIQDLFLAPILQGLLIKQDIVTAETILRQKPDDFPEKNKVLAQLGLYHLDCFNKEEFKKILAQLPASPQRNILLLMMPEEFQDDDFIDSLCPDFPTKLEELMAMNVLKIGDEEEEDSLEFDE